MKAALAAEDADIGYTDYPRASSRLLLVHVILCRKGSFFSTLQLAIMHSTTWLQLNARRSRANIAQQWTAPNRHR